MKSSYLSSQLTSGSVNVECMQRLFSVVRTRPSDPDELRDLVLSAVAAN